MELAAAAAEAELDGSAQAAEAARQEELMNLKREAIKESRLKASKVRS